MGWTSFRLEKDNVSNWFKNEFNVEKFECVKHAIVGNTIYGAIKNKQTGDVFAVIFLIRWDNSDYSFNFSYKDMDETMNPFYYDCPMSILKLLTPTENEYALLWRSEVEKFNNKKKLSKQENSYIKLTNPIRFSNGENYDCFKDYGRDRYVIRIENNKPVLVAKVKKFSLKHRAFEYVTY